jgi:DNA polymerase type B, organellar and viral
MATKASFSITDMRAPGRHVKRDGRPFMGVDGEGCGMDRHGRQHYMLLRAGPHELFTGKPLTTFDCLEFICSLPATHILVGFAFGYDVTQILRDLSAERLQRIFTDKEAAPGTSRYTYWNDYAIEYLPRNYLRVARVQRGYREDGTYGVIGTVTGSARTIWETFGCFQTSFLKAIRNFDVGKRYWPEIDRQKRQRSKFVRITKSIRRYCELECALLAAMMEKFRIVCHAAGIHPNQWAGAGKLAAYLHRAHGTITGKALLDKLSPQLMQMANDAYYGGRFEITRVGEIGPCHEADINSAYPAAMLDLPCLEHGTWQRVTPLWLANAPETALFVAEASFTHPEANPLCGLPVRHRHGHLCWPREGGGTYWSPELRSAQRLGAKFDYRGGWRYVSHCKCQPFGWAATLYAERLRLGKATAGYPIKLGLNSLYGKLAQRIGQPVYGNFIHAGLITALTRARLNDAIALAPSDIVMIATDAIVSLSPLPLPIGPGLGQWETKSFDNLFVVQPGLYWEGRRAGQKRKTRGVSTSIFARHMHRFEKRWRQWCERYREADMPRPERLSNGKWRRDTPRVTIRLTLFIGLKLAAARGDLVTAGRWQLVERRFDFEWGRKRLMWPVAWESPTCLRTLPLPGGPDFVSCPHRENMVRVQEMERHRAEYEDQPEVLDLAAPGDRQPVTVANLAVCHMQT